ncbi:unnamed protein product [Ilex paraguariensis]|uniref:F-box associated beta-propeller type 3 domain-containing protein n=1 Tax=Ilex paraguariensis TaxID=185542 RepID=A0ABC8QSX3_9AQUA
MSTYSQDFRKNSLQVLRCIWKQWRNLISFSYFKKLHHHRSKLNPLLLHIEFLPAQSCPWTLYLNSMDMNGGILEENPIPTHSYVVNKLLSCFELICFGNSNQIVVCNPGTKEILKLQALPYKVDGDYWHEISFGYLPSKNVYKIVDMIGMVVDHDEENNHIIISQVYTLSEDNSSPSWRRLQDYPSSGGLRPLFEKDGEIIFSCGAGSSLVCYDIKAKSFRRLSCKQSSRLYFDGLFSLGTR